MAPDDRAPTRRTVIAGATALLAGCADDDGDEAPTTAIGTPAEDGSDVTTTATNETASGDDNPATGEVSQMGELTLSSPAFADGERIPDRYGYEADNVNPPLEIAGVPDDAESLALAMDDPDAVEPAGKVWDHWIVWNVPPDIERIPEGWEPAAASEGTNDFGEVGYGGPNPPDGEHRYRFKCFALDTSLDRPESTDVEALGEAMAGHVLARTQLDGTYPP